MQLQKDVWQKLEHNDQISLLHYSIEELVFTVKLMEKETLKDSSQNTPTDSKSNQQPSSNVSSELNKPLEQDSISNTSNEQMLKTDSSTLTVPETSSVTTSSTASSSMRKTRKLPSWLLEIKPSDSKPASLQKSASHSSICNTYIMCNLLVKVLAQKSNHLLLQQIQKNQSLNKV